jgi:hypothetical protein
MVGLTGDGNFFRLKKKSVWANLKMGRHWASNFAHIGKVRKMFSELFLSWKIIFCTIKNSKNIF